MKTAILGALALWTCSSFAMAQPILNQTEAQAIIEKCRAAYAALQSYRGRVKTNSVSIFDGKQGNYGGSAKIVFAKPNLLRIDGKLANGGDFSILSNAEGSWYRWPVENDGKWKKVENLGVAVSSMTGVAARAPTTISMLLVPSLGRQTFRSAEDAKVEGEETIDGQACFKITARSQRKTTSWWIDKKTFLLRRIFSSYDEEQSAAMLAQVEKASEEYFKKKGQPTPPKIEKRFVSKIEDLEAEALNGPIDEKLFATPTAK